MALHLTPEEHDANPPSSWTIKKAGRKWALCQGDVVLDYACSLHEAEAAKVSGPLVRLYDQEGRWFAGDTPTGWLPYAELEPYMRRAAERLTTAR